MPRDKYKPYLDDQVWLEGKNPAWYAGMIANSEWPDWNSVDSRANAEVLVVNRHDVVLRLFNGECITSVDREEFTHYDEDRHMWVIRSEDGL